MRVFAAGAYFLCEKPLMTSARDAAAVSAEAEAAGASLYVGHFRRLFPQVELARELIGLGLIGDVTAFSASEGGRFTWRAVSNYTTESPGRGLLGYRLTHPRHGHVRNRHGPGAPLSLSDARIVRDQAEPSHDFMADFRIEGPRARCLGPSAPQPQRRRFRTTSPSTGRWARWCCRGAGRSGPADHSEGVDGRGRSANSIRTSSWCLAEQVRRS